ncbi:glycine receptor subunit alpha-2-like isoform X2 [Parasteatoda tepidariorum]
MPVEVFVTVKNINIRSVDENDMSFTVSLDLWQNWLDMRLTYPHWSEKKYQILDTEWRKKIWNPNLYFVNAIDGKINNIITPSSFYWLSDQNQIFFSCRALVKLICDMDLHHFPHDVQTCGMQMASASFASRNVVLKWTLDNYTTDDFYSLQQYEVTDAKQSECVAYVGPNNASCLEGSVVLRRRNGFYLINVYIPTILIVIMSMLTFWIPPEAVPARVTLGVTSLLTIITKQYQASMPNVSYIVALNVWLSSCIGFVFLSLLEFATVIALMARSKNSSSLANEDESELILGMILLKANGTWSTAKPMSNLVTKKKSCLKPLQLDYFSRVLFPLLFIIFSIAYWKYYGIK